jgi:hypothetical protein
VTTTILERPDFNMVARLYERRDDEDEIGGPGGRLVRHHPAGCQGTPVRMLDGRGRRGWYPAPGTPEELVGKAALRNVYPDSRAPACGAPVSVGPTA